MRQGCIEQIGTPQEIYNCPQSLYVADFMGYSNRLPVEIVGRDGNTWVVQTTTGLQLRGSTTSDDTTSWQPGQHLLACSRPDETLVDPPPAFNQLRGLVHLTEYVGKAFETVIRLEGDERSQLFAHSERPREAETTIQFGVRPDRLLLFSAEEQQRLFPKNGPAAAAGGRR
jgi:ABC-type Fe3+/spermidine/putrescine transport system ATPase subunit